MTQLHVEGEVQSPQAFGFTELRALSDQIEDVSQLIPGREGKRRPPANGIGAGRTGRNRPLYHLGVHRRKNSPPAYRWKPYKRALLPIVSTIRPYRRTKAGRIAFLFRTLRSVMWTRLTPAPMSNFWAASASVTRKVGMSDRSVRRRTRNIIKSPATSIWTEFSRSRWERENSPPWGGGPKGWGGFSSSSPSP